MKKFLVPLLAVAVGTAAARPDAESVSGVRAIRLVQDDAQVRIASKIYELKHVNAIDILPYISAAVRRYDAQSRVEQVDYTPGKRMYLIVSTAERFLPCVDELIAKLDRPGRADAYGSLLEGTGMARIAYQPDYRAAESIAEILTGVIANSEGRAYLNRETNTIYWKDEKASALRMLRWVRQFDRPVPQATVRLNYYEVRESTLRDIGFDYLAWKNGPGVNFFSAGYNAGKLVIDEMFTQMLTSGMLAEFANVASSSWGYGGFFTAPYFDMSFIRILQQSGNAKLAGHAEITCVNTPLYEQRERNRPAIYSTSIKPDYQNMAKNASGRNYIAPSDNSDLRMRIFNPVICLDNPHAQRDGDGFILQDERFYAANTGAVIFDFHARFKNVVERGDLGQELANTSTIAGGVTLPFHQEKILATYEKENRVEQNIGFPFFSRIPYIKYLFGTTTTITERTYIIITAEANLVSPDFPRPAPASFQVETKKVFTNSITGN